jgi:hypothetical protein
MLSSETITLASTASMGGLQLCLSLSSPLQKRVNLFLLFCFLLLSFKKYIDPSNVVYMKNFNSNHDVNNTNNNMIMIIFKRRYSLLLV